MTGIRFKVRSVPYLFVFLMILLAAGYSALAWENYSTTRDDGNCATCHGNFRSSPYVSLKDGVSWGDDLHDVHRNEMVDGDCNACHDASRFPDPIATSIGGIGWPAIGCTGCHGRAEDASGAGTEGYSAGLRQRHFRAGETVCVNCHADSNPVNMTPAGEEVLPPYYALIGNHLSQPTDPCNPNLTEENYAAATIGLDNDGDDVYDMADTDCSGVSATPGESSGDTMLPLLMTAHDTAGGTLTLSYESGCATTDNNLAWGPLDQVATYAYGVQTASDCAIGAGGSYVWSYPATPSDIFFLVVGNTGDVEGSLGLDSAGVERPEDTGGICDIPQDLTARCD